MKKLLIMTGVAAFAFGAFAFSNGSGFDSLTAGEAFTAAGDNYWGALPSDLEATVTAYAGSGETAYATRPAYFTGDNVNFLAIESASAADPLVRYINESSTTGKDIGNGLYLDTLVQFTVSTETMGVDNSKIGDNERPAKLAIWAQTSDENPATTNFVVQAGYITAGGVEAHNYAMTAPANFDFTAWHRLTVKAIGDIGGGYVGFVVFVDGDDKVNGTALTRANSAAIGDEGYVPTLNTVADKFAAAVLPSMIHTGDTKTTLQSVGFSGNGKIDDVSFTDVAPDFAADATVYTVTWGAGITGVSYNSTAIVKDAKNEIPAGASFELVVALDSGYVLGAPIASDCTVTGNGNTFTVSGATAGASIEFTAFQPAASVVVGNTTTYYASLADAFDEAIKAGGKITLSTGATLTKALRLQSNTEVFVDLNGQTITGAANRAVFNIEAGTLIITNSSALATGEVTAGANGQVAMLGGGLTKIYGGKFTGDFEADGVEKVNALELYGGKYDETTWVEKSDVESVAKATVTGPDENGYFTVGGETPPEPTTYTVTFVDYDGTEISSGDVAEGETPTAPTAPSRTGYTFTGWTPTIAAVTEAVTYTATYSANTYTVTFYTNSVEYATANYTYGDASTYTAPADPVVDGFTFGGWFTDNGTFETAFVFSAGVAVNTQVAYAKLTANEEPPEIEPVDPAKGGTAEFSDAATAIAAADAINEDKAKYIAAPEGIANTYYANVEAKADGTTVSVVFTTAGETAAQTSADAEVDELDKVLSAAAAGATEASITGAVPGFFYSVVYGTSLTGEGAFATEGTRAQADKDGNVTIQVPTAGEGAGFYKVKVSPTK